MRDLDGLIDLIQDFDLLSNNQHLVETSAEKNREEIFNTLLYEIVLMYSTKTKSNNLLKIILFFVSCAILLAFAAIFAIGTINVTTQQSGVNTQGVITILSLCVSFSASVIGIIKIITEYIFSKTENDIIPAIIKAIKTKAMEEPN